MIFIEGLPCAGKSLLIDALHMRGESVCLELGKIFKRNEFPGNGRTPEEVGYINHWFIDKEHERMRCNISSFFDRSYFTHFCYAYAYSQLTSLDTFESTMKMYEEKISSGVLPKPKYIVYVDVDSEISILRQNKKISDLVSCGLPPFWRDKKFLDDTRYAYKQLFSSISGIPILTIDAEISTEEKVNELQFWMLNTPINDRSVIDFDAFIRKIKIGA
ncbi:hypothetical protein [Pectobacterium versatile]|uniref:hypothetical protein n=1 Tax=Pectobacterium versatile TaxID=2488639 RepID=UPI00102E8763|nr:hypothetical protein [Pectobacterium versatile]TAI85834.1 hypothetical protein EG330_09015 [Pectobacterium versatile]